MKDFLTITCHSAYNYGAVLQTYGLYKYLTNIGYDGMVIDYRAKYFNKTVSKNPIVKIFRPIIRLPDFIIGEKTFGEFLKNNINLTDRVSNIYELEKKLPESKVYITGSDQVWNCSPGCVGNDDAFFLRFVNDNKCKKISYAASIAMNELNDEQSQRFSELLKDFFAISVREKTGIKLLNKIGIDNIRHVLDPVYLLNKNEWMELVEKSELCSKLKNEKYILVYGFLQQKNVYDYAQKLSKEKNCKIFNVNTLIEDFRLKTDKYFWNVSPEDFLALIFYSQDVVTNSFHGLSFSIIFQKKFHLFGKKGNSSSRMFDMVDLLGLNNRIIKDETKILKEDIEYLEVNKILDKKIENSKEYLKEIFK